MRTEQEIRESVVGLCGQPSIDEGIENIARQISDESGCSCGAARLLCTLFKLKDELKEASDGTTDLSDGK